MMDTASGGEKGDDDDEWEEEELVVVAELTGILETDFLKTVKGDCSVLGIHTEKPMLQLDKYTFTGSYEDTLGTNLLFEEKPQENTPDDESIQNVKEMEFFCKTSKQLNLIRAFIKPNIPETQEAVEPCVETTSDAADQIVGPSCESQKDDQVHTEHTTSE